MTTHPETFVRESANQIREALTRLGYAYQLKNGEVWEISYKSLEYVGDSYVLLEVDTKRLPTGVRIDQLTHTRTLHHLTAVVGCPVKRLNTTGLTYCVIRKTPTKTRLPRRVAFDLGARPPGLAIPVGRSRAGDLWLALKDVQHILVGGTTRSGKSTWLNTALASLMVGKRQDEVQLALIDPKGVEFIAWRSAPHLIAPLATEPDQAETLMRQVMTEVRKRQTLFAGVGVKNLLTYNRVAHTKLPWLVVVVDEFTDIALLSGLRSRFYQDLTRLVSKGAALGIVTILATQNPKAEVINTLIRGNLATRLSFRCIEPEQSHIILGTDAASKLPTIPGRALLKHAGQTVEVQAFYLADDEAQAWGRSLSGGSPPKPVIDKDELRLVQYALHQLDGAFTIGKLAEAFDRSLPADGGDRISRWTIQKAGERLTDHGLLSVPEHVTEPRRVTQNLAELANS